MASRLSFVKKPLGLEAARVKLARAATDRRATERLITAVFHDLSAGGAWVRKSLTKAHLEDSYWLREVAADLNEATALALKAAPLVDAAGPSSEDVLRALNAAVERVNNRYEAAALAHSGDEPMEPVRKRRVRSQAGAEVRTT